MRPLPPTFAQVPPPRDVEGERLLRAILEGPGGLVDLDLAVLGLRLQYGGSHPEIAGGDGPVEVLKKAGECGVLDPQTAEELAEAGRFLLGLECVLSLVKHDRSGERADETPWDEPVEATVARACDAGDFEEVVAKAEEAAARIAAYRAAAPGPGAGEPG